LARLGFTNVAVVSNGVLGVQLGWDRGFDEYLETWRGMPETDDPAEYRKTINARRVNDLALPLLARHRDAERLFAWIHYSDPHAPYLLPEDVDNPFVGDPHYTGDEEVRLDDPRSTALGDRRDLKHYVAQYDANVWFTDRHVRALLDEAGELGLLDEALVVFTADHGESLGEHDYFFGHGRLPYNDGIHVPLVVSYPPALARGRRVGAPVELVDLYATLGDWLAPGQKIPGLEGESLMPLLRPGPEGAPEEAARFAFSQAGGGSPTTHFRSVQDERFKLIYHPPFTHKKREVPAKWELYRLEDDPGETRDLSKERPPELRRLHRELKGWMKDGDWIRRPREEIEALSQEVQKALRALGYAE
jgi:arylsulfatase A-like enzyme